MISERALEHEGRYRFTRAHELGHIILHQKVRELFHDAETAAPLVSDRFEKQADRFAASFLMPLPLFEREVLRLLHERGLRVSYALVELMVESRESLWLWRHHVLPGLSKRFGVSASAGMIRCRDMRLRRGDQPALLPQKHLLQLLAPGTPDERGSFKIQNGRVEPSRRPRQAELFVS